MLYMLCLYVARNCFCNFPVRGVSHETRYDVESPLANHAQVEENIKEKVECKKGGRVFFF